MTVKDADYRLTEHDVSRVKDAGACNVPDVGTRLGDLHSDDLEWAAVYVPYLTNTERDLLYRLCGTRSWYRDGKLHREDGPAIEWTNGTRQWWQDGKLHREDGPAIEWTNGTREWWRDGNYQRMEVKK